MLVLSVTAGAALLLTLPGVDRPHVQQAHLCQVPVIACDGSAVQAQTDSLQAMSCKQHNGG